MINFPKLEERILSYWKEHNIFAKTLAKPATAGRFVFFEGPPTANGIPGLHHVLARAFKDLIPRYKTMRGFRVDRKAGWDTQGLPVELQVEKTLGFKGKPDIEKYGVEKFNAKCKADVWKYKADWEKLTERIGFWLDLANPYITYEPYYIESLWWILKQVWQARLLYKDYKVVPHCPRCGTALSSHEVALGYKNIKENSVYIKFKVKSQKSPHYPAKAGSTEQAKVKSQNAKVKIEEDTYILSWTTTPWTLPGNVALAVGEKIEYVKVKLDREIFILAKECAGRVLANQEYEVVDNLIGQDLAGWEYEPLFPGAIPQSTPGFKNAFKVYPADFVTTADGTGVVHTAVMYGEDDFNLGAQVGLPKCHTVDENGYFTKAVNKWAGKFVKDKEVEQGIVNDLAKRGLLFSEEMYEHDYPFCWRCESPLLYYARPSWFIKMSALRDELKQANQSINWYPSHIKDGRFGEWLEGVKDWAISRERYWGTPLPIWECTRCDKKVCLGSFAELIDLVDESQKPRPHPAEKGGRGQAKAPAPSRQRGRQGASKNQNFDPHRPYVDEITWLCACGGQMRRVPEVVDCWFDSGSMPFAQWGYPAARGSDLALAEHYPADFIAEAIDQTRGWFYTLLAVAVLLRKAGVVTEAPPYKNVICLGHINDKNGQKMSKSKGNVVDPWEIINQYGADALRWHFYTANQPGEPKNFDQAEVAAVIKKTFLILMNTVTFYELYKSGDTDTAEPPAVNVLDKWILALWRKIAREVTTRLDKYEITEAGRKLTDFVTELSTWYVRRSRDRFKQAGPDKNQAVQTLHYVLHQLSLLMAPFAPFLAEAVYCRVGGRRESVHLENWPVPPELTNEEQKLLDQMSKLRLVVEMALAQRAKNKIKVRQTLRSITVTGLELTRPWQTILAEEINVLQVKSEAGGDFGVQLDTYIDDELRVLGLVREFSRQVNALRKARGLTVNDQIKLQVGAAGRTADILLANKKTLLKTTLAKEIEISRQVYSNKVELDGETVTIEMV